jgi:hypothetical protein
LGDNVSLTNEDVDVITLAMNLYLRERRRDYHHQAAVSSEEDALKLSLAYASDKEYVLQLLEKVAASSMGSSAGTSPDPVTKGSSDE